MAAALDRFSPATRAWFQDTFAAPTDAQAQGWAAIARAEHTLILAPTGSGKTLAAFLWCLDQLATQPQPADKQRRCRVLYVSPLKALAQRRRTQSEGAPGRHWSGSAASGPAAATDRRRPADG